ncbi:hypothetical protein HDV06_005424 [Boothiomyces sp. JEL0866]|nr:hypothetical protein HDV06_005424 [Boothiomyces sp. JEL0866]
MMGVGSFLAGNIPITFHLNEDKLILVSTFGAGLLLGAAFLVIIPEGVETVYNSEAKLEAIPKAVPDGENHNAVDVAHDVGLSLIFGFLFMFLIDQASNTHPSSHQPLSISLSDLRDHGELTRASSPTTSTIGLVIHSAADGIALGASFLTEESNLQMVVFVAIMLHKTPAAFGLATHLLQKGLNRFEIQKHLVIFSGAAPLGAILTFLLLNIVGSGDPLVIQYRTGLVLLFSGGTFLYVAAVHILPEIYQGGNKTDIDSPRPSHNHDSRLSVAQIICFVVGMFTPYFLSFKV